MKLKNYELTTLVPDYVLSDLTVKELREVRRAVRHPLTSLVSLCERGDNEGVRYVALMTPLKYSVLQSVSEGEALRLLAFDSTRLDPFYELIWQHDMEQGLWQQHFSSVLSVLSNPNLTGETARAIVEGAAESEPSEFTAAEVVEAVGTQLAGRGVVGMLSDAVLSALVGLFKFYNLNELTCSYEKFLKG